jgi:hypothetical protein
MSNRVLAMLFGIMLVGAICATRPMVTSQAISVISTASAQTAIDRPAPAGSKVELQSLDKLTIRQLVYVPAYSTIRLGSGKGQLDLATTLSIHNTSEEKRLVVLRVDYFGTAGNLLQRYLANPITIRPLGSVDTFVPAEDTRGGTGANFVVEWASEGPIAEPLIEAVMVATHGAQGFSFTSRGKMMTIAR